MSLTTAHQISQKQKKYRVADIFMIRPPTMMNIVLRLEVINKMEFDRIKYGITYPDNAIIVLRDDGVIDVYFPDNWITAQDGVILGWAKDFK